MKRAVKSTRSLYLFRVLKSPSCFSDNAIQVLPTLPIMKHVQLGSCEYTSCILPLIQGTHWSRGGSIAAFMYFQEIGGYHDIMSEWPDLF